MSVEAGTGMKARMAPTMCSRPCGASVSSRTGQSSGTLMVQGKGSCEPLSRSRGTPSWVPTT